MATWISREDLWGYLFYWAVIIVALINWHYTGNLGGALGNLR